MFPVLKVQVKLSRVQVELIGELCKFLNLLNPIHKD